VLGNFNKQQNTMKKDSLSEITYTHIENFFPADKVSK